MKKRSKSQEDLVLEALMDPLIQCDGGWVPMPFLSKHSGSLNVHSKVARLNARFRAEGKPLRIRNKQEPSSTITRSWYRLEEITLE